MKLNSFERLVVNQPLRPFTQRWLEARPLLRMGGAAPGRVLEIGCGQGLGAEIILRDFGADEVHAFDLDRRQLGRAQRRLQSRGGQPGDQHGGKAQRKVQLWQGCTNQLPTPDQHYDAVFDFNVLHHVPDWQRGVAEIARVLRPGGQLYLLETMRAFINNPVGRLLMKHPRENRFGAAQLRQELQCAGFEIRKQRNWVGCFSWIVARRQK